MLGKLMKYEFQATARMVLPAYLGALLFSVLARVFTMTDTLRNFWDGRIYVLLSLFYGLTMFAICVLTVILVIQRFYNNLLKDEGYLSHTLPVSVDQHIVAKLLPAAVWVLASGLVLIVTTCILYATGELLSTFFRSLGELGAIFREVGLDVPVWLFFVEIILVAVAALSGQILSAYSALSVGQLASRHKILTSVAAYMALNFILTVLGMLFFILMGNTVLKPLGNSSVLPVGEFTVLMGTVLLFCIAMGAAHYFISRYFLKNRLNLE